MIGRVFGSLALAAAFGGCALAPVTAQRGCSPTGCLATVHVRDVETVRALCLNASAVACARVIPVGDIRGAVLTFPFPPGWTPNQRDVDVAAHELCHAVADLQRLERDPCHDEDGGYVR